ncbi:MAG: LytTR family DNA-binding domain-containing protein [Bacteroidota bacterium]
MKVIIIEDEIIAAKNIQQALRGYYEKTEVLAVIRSVQEAVEWLSENISEVSLIFMDIQLTDGLSFEIFERLEIRKPIIFTTAYDEFAIQAFKVNSVDYLLKPIANKDVFKALDKLRLLQNTDPIIDYGQLARQMTINTVQYKSRFLVNYRNAMISVPTSKAAYFYAEGNFVCLHDFDGKKYPVKYALNALEEILDPRDFFRISRNLIANIKAIQRVNPYFKGRLKVKLEPPLATDPIVSSSKAGELKEWLNA